MVIDTSAILAILFGEEDAERFAAAIEAGFPRLMSAATALEASLVIESELGEDGGRELARPPFVRAAGWAADTSRRRWPCVEKVVGPKPTWSVCSKPPRSLG
jgi:hypothetical protein